MAPSCASDHVNIAAPQISAVTRLQGWKVGRRGLRFVMSCVVQVIDVTVDNVTVLLMRLTTTRV